MTGPYRVITRSDGGYAVVVKGDIIVRQFVGQSAVQAAHAQADYLNQQTGEMDE